MSSEVFKREIVKSTPDAEVIITSSWAHIWAYLESAADGVNEIGYDNGYMVVEPGVVALNHVVAPGTKIKIRTSATNPVRWSFAVTQLTFIDDIISALCGRG